MTRKRGLTEEAATASIDQACRMLRLGSARQPAQREPEWPMLRMLGCRWQVVPCMSAGAFAVRLAAASVSNGEHGNEDAERLDVFGGGEGREPVAGRVHADHY